MLVSLQLILFIAAAITLQLTQAELTTLRTQLEIDEGVEYEIYEDTLGYLTFGIGHKIIEGDPEYGKPIGNILLI